jgi:hypothetical protein
LLSFSLSTGFDNSSGGDGFDDLAVGVPDDGFYNAGAVRLLEGTENGLHLGSRSFHEEPRGGRAQFNDRFGFTLCSGDFDGNGTPDLAIGSPYDDDGLRGPDSGSVQIVYSTPGIGLTDSLTQEWRLDSPNVYGTEGANDRLGILLQSGDFNGDGCADLALPLPFKKVGGAAEAGAMSLLYSSPTRISATGNQFWTQDISGVASVPEAGDRFGWLPLPPP